MPLTEIALLVFALKERDDDDDDDWGLSTDGRRFVASDQSRPASHATSTSSSRKTEGETERRSADKVTAICRQIFTRM